MATRRPEISRQVKRALFREAGNKCANPGCSNWRTHLHHITAWVVYQTHDAAHMIAICPTCHDAVHNGPLVIDDAIVYSWKRIQRPPGQRDHVYVEPGDRVLMLLGSLAVTGDQGITVFELGDNNKLGFRVVDGDVMLVNLRIADVNGRAVLRIVDGHVRMGPDSGFRYDRVPGRVAVFADDWRLACPGWVADIMRVQEPRFARDPDDPIFEIEVVEPGLLRVRGLWVKGETAVVVTRERLAFVSSGRTGPISLIGEGKDSVLKFTGPLTTSLFGFR
jgi:hypothetical protein